MTLTVNGEAVPDRMIQEEIQRLTRWYDRHVSSEQRPQLQAMIRRQAKQHAVGRILLCRQARLQGITVPDSEIDAEVERIKAACGSDKKYQEHLRARGLDADALRRTIVEARQVERLVRNVTAKVPEPSESDVKTFAEAHAEEWKQRRQVRGHPQPQEPVSGMLPFEAIKDRVREFLKEKMRNDALNAYLETLKSGAHIEDDDPSPQSAG